MSGEWCLASEAVQRGGAEHKHKEELRPTADTAQMLFEMQEGAASKTLRSQRLPLERRIW